MQRARARSGQQALGMASEHMQRPSPARAYHGRAKLGALAPPMRFDAAELQLVRAEHAHPESE
eukprot:4444778-Pyramimonas_sp.AAC.1